MKYFFKKILFNIHKIIFGKTFPVQGTGLKLVENNIQKNDTTTLFIYTILLL